MLTQNRGYTVKWLEHKIPPPLVCAFFISMAAIAKSNDVGVFREAKSFDIWVALPFLTGIGVIVLGIWEFKRANTTVDPINPKKASVLVTSGIFKFTRNPMYVGMILFLISATFYLGTWIGFLSTFASGVYLTHFQIKPEEKIIENLFGQAYTDYKSRVRRWL
ncbi:isoprenylcysteine carboxylmethyltransferase family protein [Aliiglaciecola sp. M165]|nr:isoprenylcysteine carboxylmethyltransferase family protein [Aliiglaciecola sp. M165]